MLSWWLIAILGFVLFLTIFKSQDLMGIVSLLKKNFFPLLLIGVLLFVSFSFYRIYATYNVDLSNFDGIKNAGRLYFQWFLGLFDNLGKITGYAVNQDWVLNSTNITK